MTTTSGIDTREMVVVHTAFRREFAQAPPLVRSVADGDRDRTARVGAHVRLMLEMLHHHHTGEDRLLWPKLLDRVPAELAPTVELMEAQHEGIHDEMDRTTAALDRWGKSASAADRDELAASLDRLNPLLVEHLSAEEEQLLPIASRNLSQAEWDELGEAGMNGVPRKQMPMVFGMLMKDGDPEVLRAMIAHAPLLPRLLVPRIAPGAYTRHARSLQAR